MKVSGFVYLVGFIGTIVAANYAVARWGIVPVGFGQSGPAGVYFAGLALTLRDGVREELQGRGVILAIAVGIAVSFFLEDARTFATASAIAFGVSETADSLVYEPLRRRGRLLAVAASNVVGLVIDSLLFLWIAFGSLAFVEGQILAKLYMTAAALVLIYARRHALPLRQG